MRLSRQELRYFRVLFVLVALGLIEAIVLALT
jgi:hypothetical protein